MRERDVAILVGALVLVVVLLGLLGGAMVGPGMMGWGWGSVGFWGVAMGLMMLLFWALIIGGVVWLVVSLLRQGGPTSWGRPTRSALDILRERYAKGEITREQFEQMRQDIEAK